MGVRVKDRFAHYASVFDTVELNSTFYRMPSIEAVERWRDAAPDGFVYAVKLGQFGSHRMKLRDPEGWVGNHVERVDALGAHGGPTLVQLPPRWRVDAGRLDAFLDAWPARLRVAVEGREPSWLCPQVYDTLERHGAALCLHDLLPDHPLRCTTDWTYLRFHGPDAVARPYQGRYGGHRLASWAQRTAAWLAEGVDVFAYFNNDWDANAVADAQWLRRRTIERLPVGRQG